jgi:hypothetical protein
MKNKKGWFETIFMITFVFLFIFILLSFSNSSSKPDPEELQCVNQCHLNNYSYYKFTSSGYAGSNHACLCKDIDGIIKQIYSDG